MHESSYSPAADKAVLTGIGIAIACYLIALAILLPQRDAVSTKAGSAHELSEEGSTTAAASSQKPHGIAAAGSHPPYWMVTPFALLLGAIALLPLISATNRWWDDNLHRFYVAGGLAAVTLAYYFSQAGEVFAHAIFDEYVPFIVLLFSLYTISGGIRIEGDLPAHPPTNCAFLAAGALLASFIGTTGAAMLLIRPLLETNRERKHVQHTVVFFIFIVCNCGGLLLPLGDPPLFLGYLMGVPFLKTLVFWKQWLFVNGAMLAVYYIWDRFWCYPQERQTDVARDETRVHRLRFGGLWPNVLLLAGVILSIAFLDPGKTLLGTNWRPWPFLREAVQLGLVGLSLAIGGSHHRRANSFNYAAIVEVAALFFGIFICMQPALEILRIKGPNLGLTEPWQYFWASGGLSSVLDNAPTYVVFFETARAYTESAGLSPTVAGAAEGLWAAVSLGSVLMGANTYIGNGPNFMVKAIAEKSGVAMPSFFGYLLYSGGILIPLFVLVTVVFL